MDCKACGATAESVAGVCPACGASLAEAADWIVVHRSGNVAALALIRGLLESSDIPFVIQGEGALGLFPLGPLATGLTRNLLAATVLVPADQAEAARELLEGMDSEVE